MTALLRKTIAGFGLLVLALGTALFAPAGTFDFWQAWLYLALFTTSAALITAYLWATDKELLERRVDAGPANETEPAQKWIQGLASLTFVSILVVPSLDHRLLWSSVPIVVVALSDALVALGFLIVFEVFKANSFSSATIEVGPGQRVVSTGPYAFVRHPMYAGALLMLLATPAALGSWWGLITIVPMTLVIAWRLIDEERFLSSRLPGYLEYRERVRYRLFPGIW